MKTKAVQPHKDRAFKLALLAAILAPKSTVTIDHGGRETLSTHNRKIELEWLVRDAEHLYIVAENVATTIHAYQLFNEKPGFLSLAAIGRQFKKWGWPNLSHHASCESLLERILKELRQLVPEPAPSEGESVEEAEHKRFVASLPSIPDPTLSQFWIPPERLIQKTPRKQKRYDARDILLLAHLFCREKFRKFLEFETAFSEEPEGK